MAKILKNLMADLGYNVVALPREDIKPLMLLYKNGDSVSSTESMMGKFFKTKNVAPPQVAKNKTVSNLDGKAGVVLDAEAGFSLLDKLMQALKLGKAKAKTEIDAAHKVTIVYENVKEDKVELLDLDNFLSGADTDIKGFQNFKDKLEDNELYILTHVLKSNSFTVGAEDSSGVKLDIEAKVKGIVDANVDIKKNKDKQITISHKKASEPVVFAFKAQQIIYDRKKFWEFSRKEKVIFRIRDLTNVVMKGVEKFPTKQLKMVDEMAEI